MLIGRNGELDDVAAALGEARLVTITGTGGVGKTTLASAVVETADVPVVRVLLAPLDETGLRERVAGAAGRTSYDHLRDDLRTGPHLVLLDNCEHLIDAAAELAGELLDHQADLRILATSREALALPGERVIRLDPLPTGAGSPAVELFRRAAQAHGVELTDDEDELAALCAELDGLPLALELAAARTVTMTAAEIRRHVAERLDVLSATRRGVPDRHRSLAATIAWSYQLLEDDHQRLLTRLSLLPGRFPLPTAAHLAVDPGSGQADIADQLGALVEQSLVVHEPIHGESWYRLLDTIRAFAGELLADSGEAEEVGELLADHLVARCRELHQQSSRASDAVPRYLLGSFPTIRWAIEWALDRDDQPDRAHALVAPLLWLEDVGYQAEAADVIARVVERWPAPGAGRGLALGILGSNQRIAGRTEAAIASAGAAIASGDGLGVAYGERTLGQMARARGEWAEAVGHFRRGAEAAWRHDNPAFGIEIGMHEGMTLARAGQVEEAVALLEGLLERSADYPQARAWVALFLAWVLWATDPERAEQISREELETAERLGIAWARAAASEGMAVAALHHDRLAEAAGYLHDSLDEFDRMHNRTDITIVFEVAAALFARLGELDLARRFAATVGGYSTGVLGPFEIELYRRLGGMIEPRGAEPLTVIEALAHLGQVRDGSAALGEPADTPPAASNRFQLDGDVWTVTFAGQTVRLSATKGMGDLHHLLSTSGRDVAAVDLMGAGVTEGDTGEVLDSRARRSIEERIRELQETVEEAEAMHDPVRAERAADELDQLVEHLATATGIAGRDRRAGATAERARSAVTARIRATIKKMSGVHEPLGRHFERAVVTGRFCRYDPSEPTDWEL